MRALAKQKNTNNKINIGDTLKVVFIDQDKKNKLEYSGYVFLVTETVSNLSSESFSSVFLVDFKKGILSLPIYLKFNIENNVFYGLRETTKVYGNIFINRTKKIINENKLLDFNLVLDYAGTSDDFNMKYFFPNN